MWFLSKKKSPYPASPANPSHATGTCTPAHAGTCAQALPAFYPLAVSGSCLSCG